MSGSLRPASTHHAARMRWGGWGTEHDDAPLDAALRAAFVAAYGLDGRVTPPPARDDVCLPPAHLPAEARAALVGVVGSEHLHDDHATRAEHAAGRSTLDLLAVRAGTLPAAPDAVVAPGDPAEVQALLEACAAHRIAVVPVGGGTSVVDGLRAEPGGLAAAIALDLRRLDRLVTVDPIDRVATLQAGVLLPDADALLEPHGLHLGHLPQSYRHATVGGCAATRSSGQASAGHGRFDQMVVGLRVATPSGELRLGRGPANAAGPDLRQLVLGSEGAFGVITEVEVRVRPLPGATRYEGWRAPSFAAGADALRELVQGDERPTVARLSDETESAMRLATVTQSDHDGARVAGPPSSAPGDCLLVLGWEGADARTVDDRAARAAAVLGRHGAVPLGPAPGEAWRRGRFDAPRLRDHALDLGILVETLETVVRWSGLQDLRAGLAAVLQEHLAGDGPVIVMAHVSHVYADGAALYLTAVAPRGEDPAARWRAAKAAATESMVRAGASITHHHAVGRDHAPWLADEIGPLGVDVLRAVKARLDPTGVCNPGVLVGAPARARPA